MEKRPLNELAKERAVAVAKLDFTVPHLHQKSGAYYVLKDLFFKEDDMALYVSYTPLGEAKVVFARPLAEWVKKFTPQPDIFTR